MVSPTTTFCTQLKLTKILDRYFTEHTKWNCISFKTKMSRKCDNVFTPYQNSWIITTCYSVLLYYPTFLFLPFYSESVHPSLVFFHLSVTSFAYCHCRWLSFLLSPHQPLFFSLDCLSISPLLSCRLQLFSGVPLSTFFSQMVLITGSGFFSLPGCCQRTISMLCAGL